LGDGSDFVFSPNFNVGEAWPPSYDELKAEREEPDPYLLFTIRDQNNNVIRKLTTKPKAGINRIKWNLRYAPKNPINLRAPSFYNPFRGRDEGTLVLPGDYTVSLSKSVEGVLSQIAGPVNFKVKSLDNTTLPASNREELIAFQKQTTTLYGSLQALRQTVSEVNNQIRHIKKAIDRAEAPHDELMTDLGKIETEIREVRRQLNSDRVASTLDKDMPLTIGRRIGSITFESFNSTSGPTKTHLDSYKIAIEEFKPLFERVRKIVDQGMKNLENKLEELGAPYTPFRVTDFTNR